MTMLDSRGDVDASSSDSGSSASPKDSDKFEEDIPF